ncbi:sodium:calcium antiporter [Stutzerimonas nosocomialis]|uniref:calcium/sodium antiporter n=1 Tax=Stutzerimonas nosocomialis TaxID=1056496 RepID=UPI001109F47A|nr:calcium/sodium antiporter [Stutzerimonas nosocomialis]TLX57382.1 sodium:calcium antiporter [Stutzerimonas nosocomialis]TLX60365.1 sodium:calcium antiporter [Stutzerimonas nosocomialis]
MTLLIFVYLIAGLVLLVIGAEVLVRGASRLAAIFGISPLIIGLTVVAFGTSAPETAVSVQASLGGSGDLAVGNVIGSNIANVLLILGLSALVAPLIVSRQLIRLDVPIMIGAGVLTFALAWDGTLDRLDGALLFASVVGYCVLLIVLSRRSKRPAGEPDEFDEAFALKEKPGRFAWLINLLLVVVGLVLLIGGSNLLVEGAVSLARALGLSELIIGLTVIAVGTSLPELATSMLAVFKGERDIAVGNIVGSSIFNLLLVLGAAALVAPSGLSISPNALAFDFPVMMAVFLACLPIFFSGYQISRWEGLLFFFYYLAYTAYLVLFATGRPVIALFVHAMAWYVLPLTALTLVVLAIRAWRRQRGETLSQQP